MAIVTHLGPFVGGFILPLVIYCVCDKNDQYTRHHASEGLNFSLTLLTVQLVGFVLMIFGFAAFAASSSNGMAFGFFGVFGFVWLAFFAIGIVGWVFAVIAALAASRGEWYRYPICIRYVKGAAPQGLPNVW
jgi:uncharacterized Tic20 family protein